ncbi:MAG: hypothetical protein ABWY01_09295 [Pseudoxanthomonas sp.]
MGSSTGSILSAELQAQVDLLWVRCVSCAIAEREATWAAGLVLLKELAEPGANAALDDAVQDAGYRLGIFHCNAQAARFYGRQKGDWQ